MRELTSTRTIKGSSHELWSLISDLPRMGEWSDENEGGTWIRGASGPEVGATFRGRNSNGWRRWTTLARVTESVPGERFAFRVDAWRMPVSTWTYVLADTEDGCAVTEAWLDRRPFWWLPISAVITDVSDRAEHTKASMDHTLENLATYVEGRSGR